MRITRLLALFLPAMLWASVAHAGVTPAAQGKPSLRIDAPGFRYQAAQGETRCELEAMSVQDLAAREDGAAAAVSRMLDAFAARSVAGYVAEMTADFRFDSDDPEMRKSAPRGLDRAAEQAFAQHLFVGGKRGPDGHALPIATHIWISLGPLTENTEGLHDGEVRLTLAHLEAAVGLADGGVFHMADTRNEMIVVHEPQGWRVRRWHEWHPEIAAMDSLAKRLAKATESRDTLPRAHAALAPGEHRLALAARANRQNEALVFDLLLPQQGGALEVFDLEGRRIARRDLGDLGVGRHVVSIDSRGLGNGIYWARVHQGAETVTARLTWLR